MAQVQDFYAVQGFGWKKGVCTMGLLFQQGRSRGLGWGFRIVGDYSIADCGQGGPVHIEGWHHPLDFIRHVFYYWASLDPDTHLKEVPHSLGKPTRPTRGLNASAHPKGRPTNRPTAQANAAISSTKGHGYSLTLTIRRWKDALDRT